jgi:hypothetical protein
LLNLKRFHIATLIGILGFQFVSAQTPKVKLGFEVSHLYEL